MGRQSYANPGRPFGVLLRVTAAEFIAACRRAQAVPTALDGHISFSYWLEGYVGIPEDANLPFRTEVVEALLPDFSLADRPLIRRLFAEEMVCEQRIERHDNLYQLSYYLYELGQLADCFLLYEAKFQQAGYDASRLLDREAMTTGHPVAEVIAYVEAAFARDPALRRRYPTLPAELANLRDHPDYDSPAAYREYLRGYFQAEPPDDDLPNQPAPAPPPPLSGYQPRPWWKFW